MDAIISSIITPVVQSLIDPIKKHVGFLFSSTKYVKDMNEKLEDLNLTKQDIQHNLDEAIARNFEVPKHVPPWLEKVENVNENAQSIPTSGIGCFSMAKRYKAGKQSFNILGKIQDLDQTAKSNIVFTRTQIPLAVVASTSSTGPSTSTPYYDTQHNFFESRKSVFDEALKALQPNNESQKMIALSGMGGVGKTTMMEQLKKEVEASKLFDQVVKVVLGESMSDIIAIQRAIARYINVEDLSEETIDARADRLSKMFEGMSKQGKKVLIIMDDLWNEFDLKDVGLSSPLPNGFKLLFTSREKYVCSRMGVGKKSIIEVGYLNCEEAQTLFFRVAGLLDDDHPTLQKIGKDIVKKCGGLPIAIVTIAKSLIDNIEEAWEKALRRLLEDDLEDLEKITHRIFEMSYENLKKDEDKYIFIICGVFPDDFNIRTEELLRFGWGLGFFKDAKTLTTARKEVKICVNNLIRANLLIESDDVGCVKMHDLVRAFVLNKNSKVRQASFMNFDKRSEKYEKESYDRILLNCKGMTEFPTDFSFPNLSLLMLINGDELLKFPEDIYKRMEKLEVVSYENTHIPMLPEYSTKLRTLYLRSCSFINGDVSFLGSLCNLEALSFVDCRIKRLPSTIGKLKKLRLLDLTGCLHLQIEDGVFQNLGSLEELYMSACNNCPIKFTEANCDELAILSRRLFGLELEFFENKAQPKNVSFENLERFRISIGCELVALEDGKRNLFRNTIQLVGECNELLECKINDLFDKTEELHLQVNEMNHFEDILTHISFSKLTVLHVSKCAHMTCLFTANVACGLKMLERLTISECHVMRTLVVDENSGDGVIKFQMLTFLSLTKLPNMVCLCDNIVIDFPEIVELILYDLPSFTSISPDSSEMESLFNKKVVIRRLEKLDIFRVEKLKHIWPSEVSAVEKNNVSMLKEIRIIECDRLTNLFPCNPLPLLDHLEKLEVEKCGSLEVLFNLEFESVCENSSSSKLRSIKVDKLGKLKELWRMKGVNNKCDIHIKCFNGVENIEIRNCSIFKDVFTPTTTNFDLGGLTNYVAEHIGEKATEAGTYPSNILRTSHHLQRLELDNDKRVGEVVFDQMADTTPYCCYLEILNLSSLNEMSRVWKCSSNWNAFLVISSPQHQPLLLPFQNLRHIYLYGCHKIKYLFSPLMAKYLSNLECVWITQCDSIEEVISSRDDEYKEHTASTSSHQNMTAFFPHLDTLKLSSLSSLKHNTNDESQSCQVIDSCWSFYQYPRSIETTFCDTLGSLVPWYALGHMKRLQELTILHCKTMTEIFESDQSSSTNNNDVDEGSAIDGVGATLITTPTRKTIHATLVVVPQLSNLKSVFIFGCDLLEHVFTFSTLESLKQLKELKVKYCNAIEVIVKEENRMSSSKGVVFPRLETLVLDSLPNLKGFFLGVNEFRWPSLDDVTIKDCPQLMMFTSGRSKTPKLKYISTRLGKHSVDSCGLNFHETIINEYDHGAQEIGACMSFFQYAKKIDIYQCDALESLIPWYAAGQMKRLQQLEISYCSTMMEIFESESSNNNKNVDEGSLHDVGTLIVPQLSNLKSVDIYGCELLTHVFTFSTLESLKQLKELKVRRCKAIQVIVKEEKERTSLKNVVLPRLEKLVLDDLPNLKGFFLGVNDFKWASLDDILIKDCLQLTVFTSGESKTPKLKYIRTNLGTHSLDQTSFLETSSSSNPTISKGVLPWSFNNLIEINIENWTSYGRTHVIPSHALLQLQKLEKIHLKYGYAYEVEEVFEVVALEGINNNNNNNGFNESQATAVQIPNLTQVKLGEMNDVKYLWKDTQWMVVLEFPNLTTVDITTCRKLEHVFTCSMVGSLVQLQDLSIGWCENIEVIVKEEDKRESCDDEIMLPRLKSLKLNKLPSLKGFCLGNEAFSLPSLDTLQIEGCPTIKVFTKGCLSTPELKLIDTSFGMYHMKQDLNSFIKIKQEEGYI